MSNFISRIGSAADTLCMGFIDAGVAVKKGALWVGEEGSRAMYEIYSLEGFEKWSKAFIADLRCAALIPGLKDVVKNCLTTVEAQRDLIYATLVFGSTVDCIDIKNYSIQFPKENPKDPNSKVDVVKTLYAIGNFFETAKFFQEYHVLDFPRCTQLANQLGSIQLFNFRGETWTYGNIPFLNCLCNKPKDLCVGIASFWTTYKCLKNPHFLTWENMLKLTASIGKIILIGWADYMLRKKYYLALSVVDFVTNNASLFAFLIKRHNSRKDRLMDPTKA